MVSDDVSDDGWVNSPINGDPSAENNCGFLRCLFRLPLTRSAMDVKSSSPRCVGTLDGGDAIKTCSCPDDDDAGHANANNIVVSDRRHRFGRQIDTSHSVAREVNFFLSQSALSGPARYDCEEGSIFKGRQFFLERREFVGASAKAQKAKSKKKQLTTAGFDPATFRL